jgi:glutamate synthase (NADPH/NADH) small chain
VLVYSLENATDAEVMAVFGKDPRVYSVLTKEFLCNEDGN